MPPKSLASKTIPTLSTKPDTPERAIMLSFLICHINFDLIASQNVKVGKASISNPVTSFRQCQKLGFPADLSTPANPTKSVDVYGHIDGYFLPFDEKVHSVPKDWGFVIEKKSNDDIDVIFVPLAAPIANKPLTAWALSGIDVNRNSKEITKTVPFLPSVSVTQQTKFSLQIIRNTENVPSSMQVKKSSRNDLLEQISVSDKVQVPSYYDKLFSSEKKPPSPLPLVEWAWIDILKN